MSQVAARQPRQVKALHLHDEPSYIQQFRQELLTRGLATNTRNAYIRDLMLCETTCSKAITRWDASDVLACLAALYKQGKQRAAKRVPYHRLNSFFYGKSTPISVMTTRVSISRPQNLGARCPKIYQKVMSTPYSLAQIHRPHWACVTKPCLKCCMPAGYVSLSLFIYR